MNLKLPPKYKLMISAFAIPEDRTMLNSTGIVTFAMEDGDIKTLKNQNGIQSAITSFIEIKDLNQLEELIKDHIKYLPEQ